MRGQASVEMMVVLGAALAAAAALCSALLGMAGEVRGDAGSAAALMAAQGMARAADAALNNGLLLRPAGAADAPGPQFRIQDGALLVRHDGMAAEARGVFMHDEAEPV